MRRIAIALAAAALLYGPQAHAANSGVWTPTLQATEGFDHLSAFANGVFYAQFVDTYMKSTDYGKTWVRMARPPFQYFGSPGVRFASPSIGWSATSGSGTGLTDLVTTETPADDVQRCGDVMPLHRTTDGGATWHAVCIPRARLMDQAPHFDVEYSPLAVGRDGRTLMLLGQESYWAKPMLDCTQTSDVILTTHDAGAHWNRFTLPPGWSSGYRSQVYDANTMAHLSFHYEDVDADGSCTTAVEGLWITRDGGRTWKLTYTCPVSPVCTSLAMLTPSRILLGRNDGSTMVSTDGGHTFRRGQRLFDAKWQPAIDAGQAQAGYFWAQAMSFVDAKHGFASTRGGGTWRTDDGGVSWTQEPSHECEYYLWGVGEIAAGSPTTAITGGPHFISARTETPGPQVGCEPSAKQLPAPDAVAAAAGAGVLLANGSMRLR